MTHGQWDTTSMSQSLWIPFDLPFNRHPATGELSALPHSLSRSLALPHRDLLRPQGQRCPQRWARRWARCCSYRAAVRCCHCRRILSGRAGRGTCAKTLPLAPLYGRTNTWAQVRPSETHQLKIRSTFSLEMMGGGQSHKKYPSININISVKIKWSV